METTHRVHVDDARSLESVADDSVELVVTSPPYPMIELWDELFCSLDPGVDDALADGDGAAAFELMHAQLDPVWDELGRVLVDGGIACINVGDATRTLDGSFRVYPNHARLIEALLTRGFEPLPDVLWRKPANSAAKFMGSGMLPPNAYVTLEHEYVLVFRNGETRRSFDPGDPARYESAYFWEERNRWFSDVWTDVRGELQDLDGDERRDRSAAYPFEIPYRLCCMFSAYGDTVLDPFWGTGTTSIAAICAARNSIGYELDGSLLDGFIETVDDVSDRSRATAERRLGRHHEFVDAERATGGSLAYESVHYGVPVRTKQERQLRLYEATDARVEMLDTGCTISVDHVPYDPT